MADVKGTDVPESEIILARKFLEQVSTVKIVEYVPIELSVEEVTHLLAWYGMLRVEKAWEQAEKAVTSDGDYPPI